VSATTPLNWELTALQNLTTDWAEVVQPFWESPTGQRLREFLDQEQRAAAIFPPAAQVFRALQLTPRRQTRVVIVGQDPYHGSGQADGLAFSVPPGVPTPPSLRNILKELTADLGQAPPAGFDLGHWARQGVLLLNTTLTVRPDAAGSHRGLGWETLTDQLIASANQVPRPLVFILWGKDAQTKAVGIDTTRHHVICSPHPSPLSAHRGFFGSRPFSRTNEFLRQGNQLPVAWLPV